MSIKPNLATQHVELRRANRTSNEADHMAQHAVFTIRVDRPHLYLDLTLFRDMSLSYLDSDRIYYPMDVEMFKALQAEAFHERSYLQEAFFIWNRNEKLRSIELLTSATSHMSFHIVQLTADPDYIPQPEKETDHA